MVPANSLSRTSERWAPAGSVDEGPAEARMGVGEDWAGSWAMGGPGLSAENWTGEKVGEEDGKEREK